jgi:MYXO-CTERM domain-containing protein
MRRRTRARAIAMAVVLTTFATAAAAGALQITILTPTPLDLTAPTGAAVTTMISVDMMGSGIDHLTQVQITGDSTNVLALTDAGCTSPHQCDYPGGAARSLPTLVGVRCQPDAQPRTATLVVYGDQPTDVATLTISCADDSPRLVVSPAMIDATPTNVGSTSGPYPFTVSNAGSGTISVGPMTFNLDQWSSTDPCVRAPCSITSSTPRTINVTFAPRVWGNLDSTVTIPSSGGNTMVQLTGTGVGAILDVTAPPASESYTIDFGTIAKGSPAMLPLTMQTVGNRSITAMLTSPLPPPFSLSQTSVPLDVGVANGTDVICGSATAITLQTTPIAITSEAYQTTPSPAVVTVKCAVADTGLRVMPQTFAFGELALGATAVSKTITLTNPSSVPMMVSSFKLVGTSHVLSLTPPNQALTLDANGGTTTAVMTFDPSAVEDVAGKHLEIKVDGVTLSYPITGKVVTAHAHLTPRTLDLGTACVGTPIVGNVTMVNDGTATLLVQAPTMNQGFTAFPITPQSYPPEGAALAPGKSAMAGVTPAVSSPGRLTGTLTWDVNAPEAPFEIPVTLEYIAEGTGVSPSELAFGTQSLDVPSSQQTITLENCNLEPVSVEVRGVISREGAVTAWTVDPRTLQTTLGSHGKQRITVAFEPHEPGHYAARIELAIDGETRTIELTGDAPGDRLDRTSFYACSCSGPGAPSQGWPLVAAVVLVVRRRRRRVS